MTATELPLEEAPAAGRALMASATHAEHVDPIALFGAARAAGLDAALWYEPSTGRSLVGVGVVSRLAPAGIHDPDELTQGWRALRAGIETTGPARASALAGPVLLGGAPFRDRPSTDPRWAGFRTTVFDVPRLLVSHHRSETVLTTIDAMDDPSRATPSLDLRRLVAGWVEPRLDAPPAPTMLASRPDRDAWGGSVARIAGAVGRGRLDKVVLARRVDLAAPEPIEAVRVLRRLEAAEATAARQDGTGLPSTLFAFGHGGRTFLGSSPERLASVRGQELRTMALAGTAPRGAGPAEDEAIARGLLASEKDREEHAVVAGMLRTTLAPLVADLAVPRTPRIVRSTTVQHLVTEVTGRLRSEMGLLDVAGRLHPTPAVAGWPLEDALELLDDEEAIDRGWYAGPVGWMDGRGDGDIHVAIRSGVIAGREASLFAGCGIVADSEPDREWQESTLKLRVMGDALGWTAG
jgi:menaquinone-specific isochorismate synthase